MAKNAPVSSDKNNYLVIPIPKLQRSNLITLLLVLLLMSLSFTAGSLYTKNKLLTQPASGGTALPASNTGTATDTFLAYAKQTGVNTKQFEACLADGKYTSRVTDDTNEASGLNVNATPGFFINGKFLGGAFPFESFKEIIDKELNGTSSESYLDYSESLQQAYEDEQNRAFEPVPRTIDIGDSPVRGDKNAPVTIIEYSDFQCPFCQRANTTMTQIMNEYKGKVQLVYKHLPIQSIHPNAQKAAEASECAREQNKFWEYHDLLFTNLQEWSPLPQ